MHARACPANELYLHVCAIYPADVHDNVQEMSTWHHDRVIIIIDDYMCGQTVFQTVGFWAKKHGEKVALGGARGVLRVPTSDRSAWSNDVHPMPKNNFWTEFVRTVQKYLL